MLFTSDISQQKSGQRHLTVHMIIVVTAHILICLSLFYCLAPLAGPGTV